MAAVDGVFVFIAARAELDFVLNAMALPVGFDALGANIRLREARVLQRDGEGPVFVHAIRRGGHGNGFVLDGEDIAGVGVHIVFVLGVFKGEIQLVFAEAVVIFQLFLQDGDFRVRGTPASLRAISQACASEISTSVFPLPRRSTSYSQLRTWPSSGRIWYSYLASAV